MYKQLVLAGLIACGAITASATSPKPISGQYVPGEVIVKFKSDSRISMKSTAKGKFATSGVKTLDSKLVELGISGSDQLMPLTGKTVAQKQLRAINGNLFSDVELSTLYVLKFDGKTDLQTYDIIANLSKMDEVEFAEPNYIVQACVSDYTSDPLYSQQWGVPAIKLDKLWQQKTISDRPIIAILDTGVAIDHPDLKDNIYTNYSESVGAEDVDDDGNGYKDDIHGWDFVNNSATIADYNGHGTHCAGIAAATGGNGVGVSGANPDAWILPVTVMQSNGTGDIATIIKGIDYAAAIGADVISMSFGTYSTSTALEQALGKAYSKSVLVAAAGNDSKCIYSHVCPTNNQKGGAMFPAAYSFVLGVQASNQNGSLASFSNFDEDGPIYSTYDEESLYNYELLAPGQGIMSTYPNGQYKSLNGTSMACPLVAGAISRLMQCKSYGNKESLFADIIHASGTGVFDVYATYNITDDQRVPTLSCVGYSVDDTESGDGDLRADAGETLAIYPTLRNEWGLANNIKIWLTMDELEDASLIQFLDADKVDFGSDLNSYAKAKATNPIRIKVADNTVDGRIIKLQLHATCDNIAEELVQDIELTVENGVELGGVLKEDTTLDPNVHYIVTEMLGVPAGVTLTIKPGTVIKFKENAGISVASDGLVKAVGEPGNMIVFTMDDHCTGTLKPFAFNANSDIKYCRFENINIDYRSINGGALYDCILSNITASYPFYDLKAKRCNLVNCIGKTGMCANLYAEDCNIINNYMIYDYSDLERYVFGTSFYNKYNNSDVSQNNNSINNRVGDAYVNYDAYSSEIAVIPSHGNYLGSAREDILSNTIWDMHDATSGSLGEFDMSTKVERPNADAHGCVWKVVVNDYDAQDQFEEMPQLGVGRQKFEVYFNRKMNTAVAPTITMGVRAPYTQTTIGEEGSWNEAGDVYTAYVTLNGKADIDGTNRIYVYGAEDDEFFECPEENVRFNVVVQAAGSMSTGFEATAGIGKIDLEWESPEENIEDILGYNMYRYTMDADGNESDAVRVNTSLIDSEEYTDYDVVPGTTYYYYYKVLKTDLTENSSSKVVAAAPLTSTKGDANGSLSVDVADVLTEVSYMLGQDPQPFIFEAADVNSDSAIDVRDVVGTVNIIQNSVDNSQSAATEATATYSISDGVLYIDSTVDLGGVQVLISAPNTNAISALDALDGFEKVGSWKNNDTQYFFIAFSMTGKSIPAGNNAILYVGDSVTVDDIVLSTPSGQAVAAFNATTTGIGSVTMAQMTLPYPNPFDNELTVPYTIGQTGNHQVVINLTDLNGRTILSHKAIAGFGEHSHTFSTGSVAKGFYILNMFVDGHLMQSAKLIRR
jgi:subtilisin family serine protease